MNRMQSAILGFAVLNEYTTSVCYANSSLHPPPPDQRGQFFFFRFNMGTPPRISTFQFTLIGKWKGFSTAAGINAVLTE